MFFLREGKAKVVFMFMFKPKLHVMRLRSKLATNASTKQLR